jgi:hypothetical protein
MKTIEDWLPIVGSVQFTASRAELIRLEKELKAHRKQWETLMEQETAHLKLINQYLGGSNNVPNKTLVINPEGEPFLIDKFNGMLGTPEGPRVSLAIYKLKGKPMNREVILLPLDKYLELKILNPQYDES